MVLLLQDPKKLLHSSPTLNLALNDRILKCDPGIKEALVGVGAPCSCKWRLLLDVSKVCRLCRKEKLQMANIEILVFSTQPKRSWLLTPSTVADS